MSKAVKRLMVEDLKKELAGVRELVAGSTVGLKAQDTVRFRTALRAKGVRALMVKNSMCARALEALGMGHAQALLDGPTTLFFGGESLADTARILVEQARVFPLVKTRGGVTGEQILSAADVVALSRLPSREEILGMIVGGLLAPVGSVVSALLAPAQQVASQIEKLSEREEPKEAA